MTQTRADVLIEQLAAGVGPVRPLRPPAVRATLTLAAIAFVAGLAIFMAGDIDDLRRRHSGRETLLAIEMTAMFATGVFAIVAAFFLSIPGRSKRWLIAPLPPFFIWLLLSGLGCYGDFVRSGGNGWELGESTHCLLFILVTSTLLAPLLIWRLARARPIDPLPVALLGGLGTSAISAFVLVFFHPFAVTFIDLSMHLAAILIVVAAAGLINRRAFAAT